MSRSLSHAPTLTTPLRAGAALLVLAAGLAVGAVTAAAPVAAAEADCVGSVYLTDGGTGGTGNVYRASLGGAVEAAPLYDGAPDATTSSNSVNQLGLGKDRSFAISTVNGGTTPYLVERDFERGGVRTVEKPAGAGNIAGAVDPQSGTYYFGGYSGSTLTLYAYRRGAAAAVGPVASITVPGAPGTNGDMAFGSDGTLYFVSASDTVTNLYRLDAELPESGPQQSFTASLLTNTTGLSAASNGIAFASDGYLYLGTSGSMQKVNPITGARTGGAISFTGTSVSSTDLGTCATPNTIEAGVTLPDSRLTPGDQFVVEVSGGSYANPPTFPSGTTQGSDPGPQTLPAETAGPGLVLPGETYTVSVTGAPGTDIDDYATLYTCTDAAGSTTRTGPGTSFDITPAAGTGVAEDCTFTVQNPVSLTKSVSPTSFGAIGDELFYTFVATNDDNAGLADFRLADPMPGLGAITCAPVALGGVLPAGGSTTCTATYTVTSGDVRSGSAKSNTARMTTDPRAGSTRVSSATSSVTAANAVAPLVANDDAAGTAYATAVTLPASADDADGSSPVVATSTTLTSAAATAGGTLLTTAEGDWEVLADGRVRFTPGAGWSGTTAGVTYEVTDENGFTDTATLTVTVRPGPAAVADTASTAQDVDVVVDLLGDDTPGRRADGTDGSWVLASVELRVTSGLPSGSTLSLDRRTLTVPGQGTYTVRPDGAVAFDPEPSFTGPASPVTYEVVDQAGNPASSTLTLTVRAIAPTATDDTANTPFGTAVTLPAVRDDAPGTDDNGTPGDVSDDVTPALVPGATVFPATGQPTGASVSPDGRTLDVVGQGTWALQVDGSVRFTPTGGYAGTTDPVTYRIEDVNGTRDTATLTVTVRPGPSAVDDTGATPQNVDVSVDVLDGDTPGRRADGSGGSWDVGSVALRLTPSLPAGSTVSLDGRTLTVRGQGVHTVQPDGSVVFDPEPTFSGVASPVTYAVTDSQGNTATATVTITVTGIAPAAEDDGAVTRYGRPVVLEGLTDDSAGAPSAPLVPGATVLPPAGQPAGAVSSPDGRTLTVPREGAWVVLGDGTVRFTPADGFSGATSPVVYRIEDANGTHDTATLSVTVRPGPVPAADAASTPQNVTVTLSPLGNDTPAVDVDGTTGATLDRTSLVLVLTPALPTGSTVSPDGRTLTVPGQGTWTVGTDGTVSFDPLPPFTGVSAPVTYEVTDSFGNVSGSTLTVAVDARTPTAVDDARTTPHGVPVVVDVLGNDLAAAGVALDATTLRLLDPRTGEPTAEVAVAGQGTWTVVDGAVRFVPAGGFSGSATPVAYVVADANGTPTRATVSVVVGAPGTVDPVSTTTTQGEPVTIDVTASVTPPPGLEVDVTTLCLLPGTAGARDARGADCVGEHTEPGVGTWVVNPDGTVTFTPVTGFSGVATIDFHVEDTAGNSYEETVEVEVEGADAEPVRTEPEPEVRDEDQVLPDTGGVPFAVVLASLLSLVLGSVLVLWSRRRA